MKGNFIKVLDSVQWCDVAIEVVDSRNIEGTRSKKFDMGLRNKLLIVASKADLLPKSVHRITETDHIPVVYFSSRTRDGLREIFQVVRKIGKEKELPRIRVAIFGIPNTGKSTLINVLRGRHVAQTGFRPGITRGEQWINIGRDIILCDTPGILVVGDREWDLAEKGAMESERLKNPELAAEKLIGKFVKTGNDTIFKYYGVEKAEGVEALEKIALKRGMLLKKGEPNLHETAKVIVRDFQKGKFVLTRSGG